MMFDKTKVHLGIAPIGWCNDDMPELGGENTFRQIVSEMALDVLPRLLDEPSRRRNRRSRFALDYGSGAQKASPAFAGTPGGHHSCKYFRRFVAEVFVVYLYARKRGCRVFADDFVVVHSEDRYLRRNIELELGAGFKRFFGHEIVGGHHCGGLG